MTRKHMVPVCAAVLAALLLAGCGISSESAVDNSTPEGLQTFGVMLDPSAQPSMSQEVNPAATNSDGTTIGQPGQSDEGESGTPSPTASAGATGNGGVGANTPKPTGTGGTSTTAQPSAQPSASASPTIAPPSPASTATYDDVSRFVGSSLSSLVEAEGYPVRSDYEYVDEEDPSQGEIGTLYFADGFTVTTRRDDSGETITAITGSGPSEVTAD